MSLCKRNSRAEYHLKDMAMMVGMADRTDMAIEAMEVDPVEGSVAVVEVTEGVAVVALVGEAGAGRPNGRRPHKPTRRNMSKDHLLATLSKHG
jgi:hypothetical protein